MKINFSEKEVIIVHYVIFVLLFCRFVLLSEYFDNKQLQEQERRMKAKAQRAKKEISHYEETEHKVYDILSTLDSLHKLRLIEKIARPVDFQKKEQWFLVFKQKFIHLHTLLDQIQKEYTQESQSGIDRKGTNSTLGAKQKIQKKDIRKIESAYNDVLIEGSFKFYSVVGKVAGLPINMETIDIHAWASSCLEEETGKSCCC